MAWCCRACSGRDRSGIAWQGFLGGVRTGAEGIGDVWYCMARRDEACLG